MSFIGNANISHPLSQLAPPLQLPASFSCTGIAWRGGHGPDCVLRLREERRNSASHAEWEEQPQEPQRSRDAQQMRGGRNGHGEEGGPGRKEEDGQLRKEQQLPQQPREPPARQEKHSPAGAAAISRSSSRRQEKQPLEGAAAVARSSSQYRIFVPVPSSPRQEQHLR
jgi:hypothetical protein